MYWNTLEAPNKKDDVCKKTLTESVIKSCFTRSLSCCMPIIAQTLLISLGGELFSKELV